MTDMKIQDFRGIGMMYGEKFMNIGVMMLSDLLNKGKTAEGRRDLALKSGIDESLILKWVNQADLTRINGVGPVFSELLEASGVDTVNELGHENVVTLIPIAPGLPDGPEVRQRYLDQVLDRLTRHTGQDLRRHLVHQRSYCIADFEQDYNAFRGNAYGLANTLLQTAVLKPRMKSRKVAGLYYTGQLTVPGPGVPPAIISGQVVAGLVDKDLQRMHA